MAEKPWTPNLELMAEVSMRSQELFEIIEWLAENTDLRLCRTWQSGHDRVFTLVGTGRPAQKAVARFYGIDLDEVDREKVRLLEWVREQNAGRQAS